MDKKQVGNRIKDLREEQELSQDNVCAGVWLLTGSKVSKGMLSNWESGKFTPSLPHAAALARYLRVSLDYIIGRTDVKTPIEELTLDLSDESAHLVGMRLADPNLSKALEMYFKLDGEQKQQVIDMIEFLYKKRRKK